MPSHNLYTEAAEELGYIGLALLLALIWSFLRACWAAQQALKTAPAGNADLIFLHAVAASLVVVVAVDLFFSFAAYGLSEPYWYFFGGLSVVTVRHAARLSQIHATMEPRADASRPVEAVDYYGLRRRRRANPLTASSARRLGTREP